MQAGDLAAVAELSGPVRGAIAFVAVLVLGAGLAWRREAFVERSIAASMDRPLSALVYGVASHAVIAFGGVYLANQLSQVGGQGGNAAGVGLLAGAFVLLLAGALGFTVVGSIVAEFASRGGRWSGPVAGAVIASGTAVVEPVVGALVWFIVVSTGIGGAARKWFHASAGPDP